MIKFEHVAGGDMNPKSLSIRHSVHMDLSLCRIFQSLGRIKNCMKSTISMKMKSCSLNQR